MYQTYLFDLYGTLVDIRTDEEDIELWRKLSVFYGYYGANYTPEELYNSFLTEEHNLREEAKSKLGSSEDSYPEIVLERAFQALFEKKGIQASNELAVHAGQFFRILSLKYIKLYPNIVTMLETLQAKQKKVYLISNAQQIFTEYDMNYLDIKKYFNGILFSSDAGVMKPDIRIYEQAIDKFQIDKDKAVMIGNDYTCDILGAKAAGLDAFYVHTNISPAMPKDMKDTKWMYGMDGTKLLKQLLNI